MENKGKGAQAAVILFANSGKFLPPELEIRWDLALDRFSSSVVEGVMETFLTEKNATPSLSDFLFRCRERSGEMADGLDWSKTDAFTKREYDLYNSGDMIIHGAPTKSFGEWGGKVETPCKIDYAGKVKIIMSLDTAPGHFYMVPLLHAIKRGDSIYRAEVGSGIESKK